MKISILSSLWRVKDYFTLKQPCFSSELKDVRCSIIENIFLKFWLADLMSFLLLLDRPLPRRPLTFLLPIIWTLIPPLWDDWNYLTISVLGNIAYNLRRLPSLQSELIPDFPTDLSFFHPERWIGHGNGSGVLQSHTLTANLFRNGFVLEYVRMYSRSTWGPRHVANNCSRGQTKINCLNNRIKAPSSVYERAFLPGADLQFCCNKVARVGGEESRHSHPPCSLRSWRRAKDSWGSVMELVKVSIPISLLWQFLILTLSWFAAKARALMSHEIGL